MVFLYWLRGVRYKFVSGFRMVVGLGVGNDGDGWCWPDVVTRWGFG